LLRLISEAPCGAKKHQKLKINTKPLQIIPIPPGGANSTTHIGASFSIQNLMHWKTVLSTAVVLGRSPDP